MVRTRDIAYASYLLAHGRRQINSYHDPQGICWWEIEGEDRWEEYIEGGMVKATTFVGIWRRLKRDALRH